MIRKNLFLKHACDKQRQEKKTFFVTSTVLEIEKKQFLAQNEFDGKKVVQTTFLCIALSNQLCFNCINLKKSIVIRGWGGGKRRNFYQRENFSCTVNCGKLFFFILKLVSSIQDISKLLEN